MKSEKNTCPVCAYPNLTEPARGKSDGGSYEICPSCGFQFGVDDDDKNITFEQWRTTWLASGAKWSGKGITKPKGWDGVKQCASFTKPAMKNRQTKTSR